MGMSPFQVVKDFERALCEYTGAPYAVTTTSCTMALLLAVAWHLRGFENDVRKTCGLDRGGSQEDWAAYYEMLVNERPAIEIPKRTYVGVPMAVIHAGGRPIFRDEDWSGLYQLNPLPVWDCARWFTAGMYGFNHVTEGPARQGSGYDKVKLLTPLKGSMLCVSFHASKTLGDTQGGAILHDDPEADVWLRRARFDGRTEGVAPKDDTFAQIGWHCYLSPDVAARLLWKLSSLPSHNDPLPWGPGTASDYPDLSLLPIFR